MSQPLRILDANLNRAREGLRVLEEYVRLGLDDEPLTARLKRLRHTLAEVAGAFGSRALLSARDIEHDVGTDVTTASERTRSDAVDVAAAAAKRAGESFRCIEEYGKTIDAGAAARVERLRYELYAIEQDVLVGGPRRARFRTARLHVLVTEAMCKRPWEDVCQRAVEGGADVLQLREKSLSDRELLARARRLSGVCHDRDALLIVNDRPDIARLAGADGVHVGQDDLSVGEARSIVGSQMLVGTSTHSLDEARAAMSERPDYIAVGPMFPSKTKPEVAAQGPRLLAEVAAIATVPVVAIGGITAANVGDLKECSAFQAAVCQTVVGVDNPTAAVQDLRRQLGSAKDGDREDGGR